MNWSLGNPYYLFLLLLLPVTGGLIYGYLQWKSRKKNLFADSRFHQLLFEKRSRFSYVFPFLYLLAVLFLILSLVDFLKGNEEISSRQKVNNVIFMLDVSNSMNVEDIEPDRLTEAKNLILNTLPKLKNDRVGIIIFAGEATSVMPLTTDYSAAETYLEGIQTSALQVQGTDFLAAMKVAVSKFKNTSKGARKVIMISDGEDNEGNTDAAANLAKDEGISITTVGVGTAQGGPIPIYEEGQLQGYKTDLNGETVISKKETHALKELASATGGQYIEGNQLDPGVREILQNMNSASKTTTEQIKIYNSIHYYQYSLALSLLFFVLIYFFNPKRDFNL